MTPIMVPDLHAAVADVAGRDAARHATLHDVLAHLAASAAAQRVDRIVRYFARSRLPTSRSPMIGRLSGTLLEKNPPQILLDVQGVAYEVDVPMSTFYNLPGDRASASRCSRTSSCARTRICSTASAPRTSAARSGSS